MSGSVRFFFPPLCFGAAITLFEASINFLKAAEYIPLLCKRNYFL